MYYGKQSLDEEAVSKGQPSFFAIKETHYWAGLKNESSCIKLLLL